MLIDACSKRKVAPPLFGQSKFGSVAEHDLLYIKRHRLRGTNGRRVDRWLFYADIAFGKKEVSPPLFGKSEVGLVTVHKLLYIRHWLRGTNALEWKTSLWGLHFLGKIHLLRLHLPVCDILELFQADTSFDLKSY